MTAAALVDWHAVAPTLLVLLLLAVIAGAACAIGADPPLRRLDRPEGPEPMNEKWYVYKSNRDNDGWRRRRIEATSPDRTIGMSVEWSLLMSDGFGYGIQFGRNGSESDLGLDLYAGRLGVVWCRVRSPWTKWARIPQGKGGDWYTARHTGIRFLPHEGCLVRGEWDSLDGHWRSTDPWWRSWSITKATVFGRTRHEVDEGESGMTRVPLPEGNYDAMWKAETRRVYYVGPLGKLRDRILGPVTWSSVDLDIPGGIPIQGKGENSYDCGMDGVFGTSGKTVEEAVGNCVRSVLRSRQRYGGPHNLTRPMTVTEAEGRNR